MADPGLENFDRTLAETNPWMNDVGEGIGPDGQRQFHALRAVFWALRDRLTPDEAFHFGSHLPRLLHGLFWEGYDPAGKPEGYRDRATFGRMLDRLDVPGAFWRRTDQTFLEAFFPDWHGLPVFENMLQYVWINLPELWHWPAIRVLHFQYERPWQVPHPRPDLAPLVTLWQAYAGDGPLPDTVGLAAP